MKKNYAFTLLLTLCFSLISLGQGMEDFSTATLPGSYSDDSFVGNNNVTWTYVASRDANSDNNSSGISLPALMLRRSSDDSKITSSTISGGIGDFSVKLYKGFTGGGDREVELFINGVSKGTSTAFDDFDEHVFSVSGINVTGDIIIEIRNITGKQVIIDDITWTVASTDPSLSFSTPTDNQVFPASTVDVPIVFNLSNFTLSGDDGNEMSDNTGDGYILGTLKEGSKPAESKNVFSTSELIESVLPGTTYVVTAELVDNSGASLSPKVETTITFTIDLPCDLQLGEATTTCLTKTPGATSDLYDVSIAFTGGNTSTYTLGTNAGTIGGDDPSNVASGTITITGITEGTDISFTADGDVLNSNCKLTKSVSSPTCVTAAACPAVGAIIITEIMQNPNAVGDSDGEYFEVYNTTAAPIDMAGWIITGGTGTETVATSLIIPANSYLVFGINADINANGGVTVDYEYNSSLFLANGSGLVSLECSATIIDTVAWDDGATFPDPTGKSMELATNKYNATDNDTGSNWAEATAEIMSGGDLGTPGAVNSFTLAVSQETIENFSTYPNPVINGRFTISTLNTDKKEVFIFNILGKKVFTAHFTGTSKNIKVNSLNSGVYILKVKEGTNISTKKLIIR